MFCNDCKHIKICKHYEYLCRYPELTLFSCSLKEEERMSPTVTEREYKEPEIIPLKLVKKDEPKKTYDAPELKECPYCNSKTYGDIHKCCKCGVSICDSCAYYGDSELSNDGNVAFNEYICEECYEGMYSEEDVTDEASIFELLTSNFNREDD